jgi:hypothetical protein
MPGSFLTEDLDDFFDTDDLADPCVYGGQSFGVQFFIEDAPSDMFGEVVENAVAYMLAQTKNVADIKAGVLVKIGTAPADGAGSGLAGTGDDEMIVDLSDSTIDTSGIRQFYVLRVANYGDDGLIKQIFLSKDKP